jgi:flap endonuclease-1
MGIKNMNRFFMNKCGKKSIYKTDLLSLSGKTIVIDTSIYLYKFIKQDALIENMYLMISLFRTYNIIPLFVFDGKPPPEKNDILRIRLNEKNHAKAKYIELSNALIDSSISQKQEIINKMNCLKKQFVHICSNNIQMVKSLINAYGISYCDANGEADQLCVSMVLSGKAWACMSDDMDMFMYGCPRVLRHFSLTHKNMLMYDLNKILIDLDMSISDFRQVMILSGTDYNVQNNLSIDEIMQFYNEYKSISNKQDNVLQDQNVINNGFYDWLLSIYLHPINFDELNNIFDLFCLSDEEILYDVSNINIVFKETFDINKLREIISNDGFVFL